MNVTLSILLRCTSRSVRVTFCGSGLMMFTCQSNGFASSTGSDRVVLSSRRDRSCCCSTRSTTSASDIESKAPCDEVDSGASTSKASRVFKKPAAGSQKTPKIYLVSVPLTLLLQVSRYELPTLVIHVHSFDHYYVRCSSRANRWLSSLFSTLVRCNPRRLLDPSIWSNAR